MNTPGTGIEPLLKPIQMFPVLAEIVEVKTSPVEIGTISELLQRQVPTWEEVSQPTVCTTQEKTASHRRDCNVLAAVVFIIFLSLPAPEYNSVFDRAHGVEENDLEQLPLSRTASFQLVDCEVYVSYLTLARFYQLDVTDDLRSFKNFTVDVVSKSSQEVIKVTQNIEISMRLVFELRFPSSAIKDVDHGIAAGPMRMLTRAVVTSATGQDSDTIHEATPL